MNFNEEILAIEIERIIDSWAEEMNLDLDDDQTMDLVQRVIPWVKSIIEREETL